MNKSLNRNLQFCCILSQYRFKSNKVNNKDAGIQRQLKILSNPMKKINSKEINEEVIEDMEADFLNAREIKEAHERELNKLAKKIDFKRIERRYFDPPGNVNMLTWADKEAMRQLHNSEPEEWTVDKLSESFPATPPIIQRVLKSNWRLESSEKIMRHDNNVSNNWKKFIDGSLKLHDQKLAKHLKNFTSRNIPPTQITGICMAKPTIKPSTTEFSSIVTDYECKKERRKHNLKNVNTEEKTGLLENTTETDKTSCVPEYLAKIGKFRKKPITLDALRQYVEIQTKYLDTPSKVDEHFVKGGDKKLEVQVVKHVSDEEVNALKLNRKNSDLEIETCRQEITTKVLEDIYPMKISIPKEKLNKESVYKLKDCFYDSDGEFLYRVPGLVQS